MKRAASLLLALVVVATPIFAQTQAEEPEEAGAGSAQADAAAAKPPRPEPPRLFEQITVESASRSGTALVDAPATMSVVTSGALALSPAQNYGDLLRSVPGMNVIQMSARDVNLTTRQGTSTLNNSQLVLVDGRSVYLDFFGLVLWDFLPDPAFDNVKQIEVVRGPASVVWGANALSGVVNVITKTPRENPGLALTLRAGVFGRDGGSRETDGPGGQYAGSFSYAGTAGSRWSYRLAAGYFSSDAYSRPVGEVPLGCHPLGANPCRDAAGDTLPGGYPVGGAPYPADTSGPASFVNEGTSQPKLDLRVDQELGDAGRLTYQAGYAGTEGIIHTGIGPFDIESGSHMSYGRAVYDRGALRISAFANFVDADAPNLLQTDPATLRPVVLGFDTRSYDLSLSDARAFRGRHLLSYGGNYRRNEFDITMAPGAEDRNEFGAYLQEELFVSRFRLAAGVRADKFGNLDHWVFSPRLSLMYKPGPDQSLRASYNRAFRSPSVINQYLDQSIFSPTAVDLRPLAPLLPQSVRGLVPEEPLLLIVRTTGQQELREESVEAWELAYAGTFGGRWTFGAAVYQNVVDDNINFVTLTPDGEHPSGLPGLTYYSVDNPAQGVGTVSRQPITLDPRLMGILDLVPAPAGPIRFPETVASYMNLGPIRQRGVELSLEYRPRRGVSAFASYSWQATPKVLDPEQGQERYPLAEVGPGPKHRFNVGGRYDAERAFFAVDVNHTSEAFWNDVLDAPYHGTTDAYTMLNATVGAKVSAGKLQVSLRGTNLLGQRILQHVYGDVVRRALVLQVRFQAK